SAPKFKPAGIGSLMTDPIDSRDVDAIGDRVRSLNRLPSTRLGGAKLGLLCRMPADRRGIKENLRSFEGCQTSGFWVPLVPADQCPHAGERCVEHFEAKVAGGEVVLLVVKGVVGYVHLSIAAAKRSVAVKDDARVVIDPRRAVLKDRSHHRHVRL